MGTPWDPSYDPPKNIKKLVNLIKIGSLLAWKNLWGYGRKVHAKFCPWGTPWDPSYDPPESLQKTA
jgi:hypothetical protein